MGNTADNVRFYGRIQPRLGAWRYLRRLWRQARCEHTHCAKFDLDGATRIYGAPFGSHVCRSPGIQLCCCYICGLVWVRDYRA